MRSLFLTLAFLATWFALAIPLAIFLGRFFRLGIQSDEARTRALMRRGARLDIQEALSRAKGENNAHPL
jgi:hypothetical protein